LRAGLARNRYPVGERILRAGLAGDLFPGSDTKARRERIAYACPQNPFLHA